MDYLLADGGQPVEAITWRFEANDTLAWATETGVTHAHRRAPRGGRRVVAGAACGCGAARRGESGAGAGARRRHDQRHVRRALLHAAAAPTFSPKSAVLRRLQVLTFQHGTLECRRRLQKCDCRVLHRWSIYPHVHFSNLVLFYSGNRIYVLVNNLSYCMVVLTIFYDDMVLYIYITAKW